jgi:hypothetical protein
VTESFLKSIQETAARAEFHQAESERKDAIIAQLQQDKGALQGMVDIHKSDVARWKTDYEGENKLRLESQANAQNWEKLAGNRQQQLEIVTSRGQRNTVLGIVGGFAIGFGIGYIVRQPGLTVVR